MREIFLKIKRRKRYWKIFCEEYKSRHDFLCPSTPSREPKWIIPSPITCPGSEGSDTQRRNHESNSAKAKAELAGRSVGRILFGERVGNYCYFGYRKVILLFPEMHFTFLFPLAIFTGEFSEEKVFSSKNNIKEREIFYFILSCSMYSLFSLMYSSENL